MRQCARCALDLGAGGIPQKDGTFLCGACDLRVHGPTALGLMPDFCPKCHAAWERTSTYCLNCNWDAIAQEHRAPKIKKAYYRVSVDWAGIALAVAFVVGGYMTYDYYQTQKKAQRAADIQRIADARAAKEAAEEAARQRAELARIQAEAERQREEAQRVAAEETARKNREKAEIARQAREAEAQKRAEEQARQQAEIDERNARIAIFQDAPAATAADNQAAEKGLPVFHLADGRQIKAYDVRFGKDMVILKDSTGNWIDVKNEDVLNITRPH